jgi:uncharacterized C2H2 Zn-finger protein
MSDYSIPVCLTCASPLAWRMGDLHCPRCSASAKSAKDYAAGPMITRHPNSARFHELLLELADLHDKKQKDYGRGDDPFANIRSSAEWGVAPWVGALIRLNDKVRRLQAFALRGDLSNESAEDSMRDIAVYSVIAMVLYEIESKNNDT